MPAGAPSLEDFPHWHEDYSVELRQWKKGYFNGYFAEDVFRAYEVHTQGNTMQVFLGHVTSHSSRNESSKVQEKG